MKHICAFKYSHKVVQHPKKYQEVSQKGKDFKKMATSAMISVATLPFLIPHMNSMKTSIPKKQNGCHQYHN